MSKLFMYGTPLEEIERLMVMVPDFQPRRSGIVINNYFNYGGDKGCSCNSADVRNRYNARSNTPFNARLNICEMEYGDLVRCSFGKIRNHSFKERMRHLINIFNGEIFLNPEHKERFYYVIYSHDLDICDISPRYIAVVFLLTSNEILWNISEDAVKANGFDFNKISLKQIGTDGYAIYQTAKTIWTGKEYIRINEIADRELIDDTAFKIIINASLIAKYGADVFSVKK